MNSHACQMSERHVVDFFKALEKHERPPKGQCQKKGEEPSDGGAERQGAETLEPAQVDLTSAVDAVEHVRQAPCRPEGDGRRGRTRLRR